MWEYSSFLQPILQAELNLQINIETETNATLAHLPEFSPPNGRIFLAELEETIVGSVAMRTIAEQVAEVKRLYVRSSHRRQGIGRALVGTVINEARSMGYAKILLDTPKFFTSAQNLYRSLEFQPISPYPQSEISEAYHQYWIFMEFNLARESIAKLET